MRWLYILMAASAVWAETGSAVCATCHREIAARYQKTPMARSSGRVEPGMLTASEFQAAGVQMRIQDGALHFARPSTEVQGSIPLTWFIGSGQSGRNFAYARDGFLFQAPVSFYARAERWDFAPGYQRKTYLELTRPIEPACLQCHASRLQPVAGTLNRYSSTPFLEGGVSCERCHGPGDRHVATAGKAPMVQPAKLATEQRDSVCAQCHLTGVARVGRMPGRRYLPGESLSKASAVFVWEGSPGAASATSHFEQLSASRCRQASADKLWCGTCHPIHADRRPANDVCASCHAAPKHSKGEGGTDCTYCHMPKRQAAMADHLAFTDHAIRPKPVEVREERKSALRSFFADVPGPREWALGYAIAASTEPEIRPRAFTLLEQASAAAPNDALLLSQLSQFYDRMGQPRKAMPLAERAIALDPEQIAAAINLGGYVAAQGRLRDAIMLWESVLRRNPGSTEARMNLAVARARSGDRAGALTELTRLLDYEPDHPLARKLLSELREK